MLQHPAPMRATRAAMFAAVCTALGAVGHSRMSGSDIPLSGLMGAFAVTGGLAWAAAGRRRGPAGIATAVLAVQGVLHLLFSGSQAAKPAPAPAHHHMPGMDMGATAAGTPGAAARTAGMADAGGMADPAGMADAGAMADMAAMAGHGGAGMIAAHVLAGLFCAAWLAWGEAAVFRLARTLGAAALHAARPLARALALAGARVAAVPVPPAPVTPYERPRGLRGAVHAYAVVRRGPPAGRAFRATAPGRPARV
ncbi:hypothetical protein [Streptomyces subrutilus]|uniref:Integral-membrane protein n=1 Tax=Streptomyces subrutilus TaxID=36818 RepID=A0A1E5PQE0_9ACTN|nr:hypothetical protein [Streptomyces subrutilus]OEJ31740.1 hypothetical protein BGK67_10630 [Streptomyces subrutilus]